MEQKQARLREHAREMSDHAKMIKLGDRWDNITGMVGWSVEKRRRYATSTRLLLDALEPWPIGSETLATWIAEAAATHLTGPDRSRVHAAAPDASRVQLPMLRFLYTTDTCTATCVPTHAPATDLSRARAGSHRQRRRHASKANPCTARSGSS